MKKIILSSCLLLSVFFADGQFLYSIGIAAGVSYGKEHWSNEQWSTKESYLYGLNGAVFAEFYRDPHFQWRSEFMYNQLGTMEAVTGDKYINQANYISFNNYLKYRYTFFNVVPYVLIGPRIEYLFTRTAAAFPDMVNGMYKFHVSGAIGVGVEKVCFGRVKPFIEFFYNHDLMPSFSGKVTSIDPYPPLVGTKISEMIFAHDFELRIGIKYVFKSVGECPHVDNSAGNPPGAQ